MKTAVRKRSRRHRVSNLFERPVVDNFCGGGGASLGISDAMGRDVDLAINHDPLAIQMHTANHPLTTHLCEDVYKVSPRRAVRRRPWLAWFSPDCTHFSRAKGATPVSKKIRGLAWIAVKWAKENPPDVIMLENVREFETWGPLIPKRDHRGRPTRYFERRLGLWLPAMVPDPARMGQTFKRFCTTLRNLGYDLEWRTLNAADYGAPTHRRRLFMIARRDGRPIVWPEPTHGPGCDLPWRTAAECIDWTLRCRSIFGRRRDLAPKTQRRIAMGILRYVVNAKPFIAPADPGFIVRADHGGDHFRGQGLGQPLSTVTGAHGFGLISSTLIQTGYGERAGQAPRVPGLDKPLGTVVSGGQKHAVVGAHLTQFFGGMVGKPLDEPIPTVTAKDHTALATAALIGVGGRAGQSAPCRVDQPVSTVTAKADRALAAVHLTKFRGESDGGSIASPLPTITSGSGSARPAGHPHAMAITAAALARICQNGSNGDNVGRIDAPLTTIVSKAEHALAAAALARFNHGDKQWNGVDEPLGTVTSQSNKFGLVLAYLVKWYATAVGQSLEGGLHTATAKGRFGLLTVAGVQPGESDIAGIKRCGRFLSRMLALDPLAGPAPRSRKELRARLKAIAKARRSEPAPLGWLVDRTARRASPAGLALADGHLTAIADIGLRMLAARELATAQSFPPDYKLPKATSRAVRFIGNSVPPRMVRALVRANMPEGI